MSEQCLACEGKGHLTPDDAERGIQVATELFNAGYDAGQRITADAAVRRERADRDAYRSRINALSASLESAEAACAEADRARDELERGRDELLAALKEVAHHADDECGFMVMVRAAIAKAEGR